LTDVDKVVSLQVARNLVSMLRELRADDDQVAVRSPLIPGYRWIMTGVGDFAAGQHLVEVKCSGRRFSSADYRQILMYWLLSYAGALEGRGHEWRRATLLNPRLGYALTVTFDELIALVGAGRSKVQLLQQFASIVGERRLRCPT
jgi:hypothetical protein